MAYRCNVTGVTRSRPTGVTITYQLVDDSATPARVVDPSGSVGLEFVRPDAIDPATGVAYTAAARRQLLAAELRDVLQSVIQRATAGDADFAAVQTALAGFTYP